MVRFSPLEYLAWLDFSQIAVVAQEKAANDTLHYP